MAKPGQKFLYMGPDKDDDYATEWILSLGRLAYSFAQLEGCSIWLLNQFCTADEKAHVREQNFVQRNVVVGLLLHYKGLREAILNDWLNLLIDMSDAAGMRNKIFHNPLNVDLRRLDVDGIKASDGILAIKKGGDLILGLGDLQEFEDKLRELNLRMLDLMERTLQT
jgi:hypothetical protein